jgi:ribosome-associated protein
MNRDDARARLIEMIVEAANPPPPRRATKPTKASKKRRLDSKNRRGEIKKMRSSRNFD